jgi:general secretion pathway protein D
VVSTTTSTLNSPTIEQRRINSSVAVRSGMEIVLGGLISTKRTKENDGIPFLMGIPILGNAFKSQATSTGTRTELLIFLRPTVMGTSADIRSVVDEIKSRMSAVRGAMGR